MIYGTKWSAIFHVALHTPSMISHHLLNSTRVGWVPTFLCIILLYSVLSLSRVPFFHSLISVSLKCPFYHLCQSEILIHALFFFSGWHVRVSTLWLLCSQRCVPSVGCILWMYCCSLGLWWVNLFNYATCLDEVWGKIIQVTMVPTGPLELLSKQHVYPSWR